MLLGVIVELNMHPEIEKFWNEAGYEVERGSYEDYVYYTSKLRIASPFAIVYKDGETPTKYFLHDWGNRIYSESEMLKIIKLKAFL